MPQSEDEKAYELKKQRDRELFAECPLIFRDQKTTKYGIQFGLECATGWYKHIRDACLKIEALVAAMPEQEREGFRVLQIKEKFGGLRLYMSATTPEIDAVIGEAESACSTTCEICGGYGRSGTTGYWIRTLCHPCHEKELERLEKQKHT